MYALQSPFASRTAHSQLYARVGVETAVDAADPHRLVALLFDGLLEAIAKARGAIEGGQLETKAREVGRAVRIVDEGLKAALNLEAGGQLAADLDALYAYLTLRLTQANLRGDVAALDECRRLVEPLKSAWSAIAPAAAAAA